MAGLKLDAFKLPVRNSKLECSLSTEPTEKEHTGKFRMNFNEFISFMKAWKVYDRN